MLKQLYSTCVPLRSDKFSLARYWHSCQKPVESKPPYICEAVSALGGVGALVSTDRQKIPRSLVAYLDYRRGKTIRVEPSRPRGCKTGNSSGSFSLEENVVSSVLRVSSISAIDGACGSADAKYPFVKSFSATTCLAVLMNRNLHGSDPQFVEPSSKNLFSMKRRVDEQAAAHRLQHALVGNTTPFVKKEKRVKQPKTKEKKAAGKAKRVVKLEAQKQYIVSKQASDPVAKGLGRVIRGRGDYELGRNVGEKVGGWIGAKAHQFFSKIFGSGDYKLAESSMPGVDQNSFVAGAGIPGMHTAADGTNRLSFKEYLGTVNMTSALNVNTYPIDISSPLTFPWISRIAANYSQWQMMGCMFVIKSLSSDTAIAPTQGMGSISASVRYDVESQPPVSTSEVLNSLFSTSGKPSDNQVVPIECSRKQTFLPILKVTPAGLTPLDPQMYSMGFLDIVTEGAANDYPEAAQVWVVYDFELLKPVLDRRTGGPQFFVDLLGTTSGAPMTFIPNTASQKQPRINTIGVYQVAGDEKNIWFPLNVQAGSVFLVQWTIGPGTATSNLAVPQVVGYFGLVAASVLDDQFIAYVVAPSSSTNTGCNTITYTGYFVYNGGGSPANLPHLAFGFSAGTTVPASLFGANLSITQVDAVVNNGLSSRVVQKYTRDSFFTYLCEASLGRRHAPPPVRARLVDWCHLFTRVVDWSVEKPVPDCGAPFDIPLTEAIARMASYQGFNPGVLPPIVENIALVEHDDAAEYRLWKAQRLLDKRHSEHRDRSSPEIHDQKFDWQENGTMGEWTNSDDVSIIDAISAHLPDHVARLAEEYAIPPPPDVDAVWGWSFASPLEVVDSRLALKNVLANMMVIASTQVAMGNADFRANHVVYRQLKYRASQAVHYCRLGPNYQGVLAQELMTAFFCRTPTGVQIDVESNRYEQLLQRLLGFAQDYNDLLTVSPARIIWRVLDNGGCPAEWTVRALARSLRQARVNLQMRAQINGPNGEYTISDDVGVSECRDEGCVIDEHFHLVPKGSGAPKAPGPAQRLGKKKATLDKYKLCMQPDGTPRLFGDCNRKRDGHGHLDNTVLGFCVSGDEKTGLIIFSRDDGVLPDAVAPPKRKPVGPKLSAVTASAPKRVKPDGSNLTAEEKLEAVKKIHASLAKKEQAIKVDQKRCTLAELDAQCATLASAPCITSSDDMSAFDMPIESKAPVCISSSLSVAELSVSNLPPLGECSSTVSISSSAPLSVDTVEWTAPLPLPLAPPGCGSASVCSSPPPPVVCASALEVKDASGLEIKDHASFVPVHPPPPAVQPPDSVVVPISLDSLKDVEILELWNLEMTKQPTTAYQAYPVLNQYVEQEVTDKKGGASVVIELAWPEWLSEGCMDERDVLRHFYEVAPRIRQVTRNDYTLADLAIDGACETLKRLQKVYAPLKPKVELPPPPVAPIALALEPVVIAPQLIGPPAANPCVAPVASAPPPPLVAGVNPLATLRAAFAARDSVAPIVRPVMNQATTLLGALTMNEFNFDDIDLSVGASSLALPVCEMHDSPPATPHLSVAPVPAPSSPPPLVPSALSSAVPLIMPYVPAPVYPVALSCGAPPFIGPVKPPLVLTRRKVLIFVDADSDYSSYAARIVDFITALIPGLHTLDLPSVNNTSGMTLTESLTLTSTTKRRWFFDLAARWNSQEQNEARRVWAERVSRVEHVLSATSYRSCYEADVCDELMHALTRFNDPRCKDTHNREVAYYDGTRGSVAVRSGYTTALRTTASNLPIYQDVYDLDPSLTLATLSHFVQQALFRDLHRLFSLPRSLQPAFRRRGQSSMRQRIDPFSR